MDSNARRDGRHVIARRRRGGEEVAPEDLSKFWKFFRVLERA
jgi:hypothetical protein